MAKDFIVAIELGSSKITGIAGKKNPDGSINVLAVVKEDSTACIRKGMVYNIDKTTLCIGNIITKLERTLKTKIAKVYVGVGGQSFRTVKNSIVKELPANTIIDQNIVNELMDTNTSIMYTDQEILDAITLEYKVDMQYESDPVGIQCQRLEGNYLNILWRKTLYTNLNICFDNLGLAIVEMFLAPLALAKSVLTDAETRSGCVLVDLGAGTTTVSVYYKNMLRHLAVLPIGGENITKDIASLQLEEEQAEKLKLKYASALTDSKDLDKDQMYTLDHDRKIEAYKFINIVEARVEEIIKNVIYQIPQEYTDKLLGGIILTGGGANLKNIDLAFRKYTNIEKIRIAKFVTQTINSNNHDITNHDGSMNTILGLLAKGNMNCAGEEISEDLFGQQQAKHQPTEGEQKNNTEPKDSPSLTISNNNSRAEGAENPKIDQPETMTDDKSEKQKKPLLGNFIKKIKDFGKKMIQEEE